MPTERLTDGIVERLPVSGRDVIHWDASLPRFGVRVTPAGRRIYMVQYRAKIGTGAPSATRKITIGEHDGQLWNLTRARAAARKLLGAVDAGGDPVAERTAKLEAQRREMAAASAAEAAAAAEAEARERDRFEVVVERYAVSSLSRKRSGHEVARMLRRDPVAAWRGRQIGQIRRVHVAELLEQIGGRSPATARLTYAALRSLFVFCIERELIENSPCDHLRAPRRPAARDRVLSDDELATVWRGAEGLGFPFGMVFKLMMLTAQREAEVAGMAWHELDLITAVWTIPRQRTKNGVEHAVDLSPEALAVIASVPRSGQLLFPRRRAPSRKYTPVQYVGERPVVGFAAAKRILDGDVVRKTKAPLPSATLAHWRLHDLRRTAATGLAGLAFQPHVIERVLNHTSGATGGLVGVYQRHEYRAERKAALHAWGAHIQRVLETFGHEEVDSEYGRLSADRRQPPNPDLAPLVTSSVGRAVSKSPAVKILASVDHPRA